MLSTSMVSSGSLKWRVTVSGIRMYYNLFSSYFRMSNICKIIRTLSVTTLPLVKPQFQPKWIKHAYSWCAKVSLFHQWLILCKYFFVSWPKSYFLVLKKQISCTKVMLVSETWYLCLRCQVIARNWPDSSALQWNKTNIETEWIHIWWNE